MEHPGPELIFRYFPDLTAGQRDQVAALEALYSEWNAHINLISRKDFPNFYVHHVLHSLSVAHFFDFPGGVRILDVGTGGGFPGIPLAIYFPEVEWVLLDSIQKKMNAVGSIAASLGLKNVRVVCSRVENFSERFHMVSARAVTRFNVFEKLVRKNLIEREKTSFERAIIYLKGGEMEDEIAPFAGRIKVLDLAGVFGEPFFQTKKIIYLPY